LNKGELHFDSYGLLIEKTMKRIRQHLSKRLNELDSNITVDQWIVLDILYKHQRLSQNLIAEKTFKDAPTVTRIIDLLCKKELANRVMDEADRRKFNIELTRYGKQKVEHLLPIVKSVRQKGWEGLSQQDYDSLIRILNTIYNNFDS
jgi:DNA-binding MarR family transcriptional regulator